MTTELTMLAWAVVLGLVHLIVLIPGKTKQLGLPYAAGARDGEERVITGIPARLERASKNFMESFPFFAAAVLIADLVEADNNLTAMGSQIYLAARVIYLPVYAFGIPYLRTLIWGVSLVGLVMVLIPSLMAI